MLKQTAAESLSNPERRGRKKDTRSLDEVKALVLGYLADGDRVEEAMMRVGRGVHTYNAWRKRDPAFMEKVVNLRARMAGKAPEDVGEFGQWREKYLFMKTYPHMWQWVDLLEGREPRDLHPAQVYRPGWSSRILVNTPPNHAKSTTITMDYVTYRICKDPNVRVIIVSESQNMAKKLLRGIKTRLTHPKFNALHQDFGPPGGFQQGAASWTESMIYVGSRDSAEKDPTVEALGVNGQIYGSRADLIILDDCISLKSCRTKNSREKLLDWINTEVSSRLEPKTGRLLVVGTRLAFDDLYQEILRLDNANVWTYLTQPAILEWGEGPFDHKVLWEDRFPSSELSAIMQQYGQDLKKFRLVYQQIADPEDATFPAPAVEGCTTGYNVGQIPEWLRPGGMTGLYTIGGLDPAGSGYTAMIVLGVDKKTKMRYVIDAVNQKNMKPHDLRAMVLSLTQRYKINEWRIEKNGLQTLISQDAELRASLLQAGARVIEHHTGINKWDPDFGVASMAPLFLGALEVPKRNLISIPGQGRQRTIRELTEQLITWEPETSQKTDLVMALWFAELGARKIVKTNEGQFATNRWATRGQVARRQVVNIADWVERQPVRV